MWPGLENASCVHQLWKRNEEKEDPAVKQIDTLMARKLLARLAHFTRNIRCNASDTIKLLIYARQIFPNLPRHLAVGKYINQPEEVMNTIEAMFFVLIPNL